MVLADDREFCARIARLNQEVAQVVFAIADDSLPPQQAERLGEQFTDIGREFSRRAHQQIDSGEPRIIDADTAEPE